MRLLHLGNLIALSSIIPIFSNATTTTTPTSTQVLSNPTTTSLQKLSDPIPSSNPRHRLAKRLSSLQLLEAKARRLRADIAAVQDAMDDVDADAFLDDQKRDSQFAGLLAHRTDLYAELDEVYNDIEREEAEIAERRRENEAEDARSSGTA